MDLHTEWTTIEGKGGPFLLYTARSSRATEPLPTVVVIQEIWGVDEHISDVADRFATAGFAAVTPDLYSRGGQRPDALSAPRIDELKAFFDTIPPTSWMDASVREEALSKRSEDERAALTATMGALFNPNADRSGFLEDCVTTVEWVGAQPWATGRQIGSVGYCMGGGLSARLGCTSKDLAAAVVYYGAAPDAEAIGRLRCPVLGFYGELDEGINAGIAGFSEAAAAAGKSYEPTIYPGAPHAFFNDTRASYRIEAARDAWARTIAFFNSQLA